METTVLASFHIVLFFESLSVLCQEGFLRTNSAFNNPGHGVSTGLSVFSARSVTEAMILCVHNEDCLSFDYNGTTGECRQYTRKHIGDFIMSSRYCISGQLHYFSKTESSCIWINHELKVIWTESRKLCQEKEGDLVVLDSDEKFMWLKELVAIRTGAYWLGARRVDGSWKWVNGAALSLKNRFWHKNQPDIPLSRQAYASSGGAYFGVFGLDDGFNTNKCYAICEISVK